VATLESPDVRQRARDVGFELTPSAPQAVLDRMYADASQVAPLVDEGRLVPF